jgi:hypothetical protein
MTLASSIPASMHAQGLRRFRRPADYDNNDPNVVEPGTFPTKKVIARFDFVGSNYDVLDADTSNDIPRPDFDPLDRDGHGTHTGGTCCGIGVPGKVGAGVAPKVKILAYKVWDVGNSTDDVLVAGYERAVDPNQDGDTSDHADVLSFSGGVDYGTLNSVEAVAAQRVVDLGTVFVASAGNSGNQPAGGSAYITGTPANARGVISVAASVDQFVAQTLSIDTPATPSPTTASSFGKTGPRRRHRCDRPGDRRSRVLPRPTRRIPRPLTRCSAPPSGCGLPGTHRAHLQGFDGCGDCDGSTKVFFAQEANAGGVIFWNGFGGFPFGLGPGDHVAEVTVPAVMLSGNDSETLADTVSPNAASSSFNTVPTTVTIHADPAPIPGFADSMTDFTSAGPARLTNDLKPDISAPGADITSAGVGTGDGAAVLSGHLDGGSARVGFGRAAATDPPVVGSRPDQGADDGPGDAGDEEQRPVGAGARDRDGVRADPGLPVGDRAIARVAGSCPTGCSTSRRRPHRPAPSG